MRSASRLEVHELGAVELQCGLTLPDARLGIATYGTLNAARDNVVLFPTRFGGTHEDNEYLIGSRLTLDPERYFVVVPNMLGNGVSSSPSNVDPSLADRFPPTTIYDNVVLQHRVLAENYGIERIRLAVGWSMGGQQVYQWAALWPGQVERLAVLCGAARTAPHTHVFLEGMRAALTADGAWEHGAYTAPPTRGLRAIGRAWAGWALSAEFYLQGLYRELGYSSVQDFLLRYWEGMFLRRDANNVLSMIRTWQLADISANDRFDSDYEAAMAAIEAEVVIMPCDTDLYFRLEDSERERALLRNGRLVPIRSVWGHYAGGGRNPQDLAFVDRTLGELLAT